MDTTTRRTSTLSEHTVTIEWRRETPDYAYETYNRNHDWSFDAGITVRASANPAYLSSETCVGAVADLGLLSAGAAHLSPPDPGPDLAAAGRVACSGDLRAIEGRDVG
jgi:hypothetical protein